MTLNHFKTQNTETTDSSFLNESGKIDDENQYTAESCMDQLFVNHEKYYLK